jgi:hypothetical protein
MANPTTTSNQTLYASQALAASGTLSSGVIDARSWFEAHLQVSLTTGSAVSSTNGLQVSLYRDVTGTGVWDTVPVQQFVVGAGSGANTTVAVSTTLGTGRWQVAILNLDTANGVTVAAVYEYIGSD